MSVVSRSVGVVAWNGSAWSGNLAFSPAFVADCLETTVEVGMEFKELFEENGGEHWQLVPSLNSEPYWVTAVADMIRQN